MFFSLEINGNSMVRQQLVAPAKGWFTPAEAASAIGVDRSTVSRWCQHDVGFATKIGSRYRISLAALKSKIREQSSYESTKK